VTVEIGQLLPETRYWIGVRAVDECNDASQIAVTEVQTTAIHFTTVSPCFVATAAYGSPLEPRVGDALEDAETLVIGADERRVEAQERGAGGDGGHGERDQEHDDQRDAAPGPESRAGGHHTISVQGTTTKLLVRCDDRLGVQSCADTA